jgi:predicted nucleic acid-binding protein
VTNGTSDRSFVDSNVLIYAHDVDAGRRREIARDLLRGLRVERTGVPSTEVLHEFYVHVTRKIRMPLPKPEARSGATRVLSEDLNPGRMIAVVSIHNPFEV